MKRHFILFSNIKLLIFAIIFLALSVTQVFAQTTVSKRISLANDDVEQALSGKMYFDSTDLELGYDEFDNQRNQTVGLLFRDLGIPQGATITNAYVRFTADGSSSGSVSLRIFGHNTNSGVAYSNANYHLTDLPKTVSVDWSPTSWSSSNTYNTPDIKTIVQQIVDRAGWASGNNISVIIQDISGNSNYRKAYAYNGSTSRAAELVVTYTICSPEISAPVFVLGNSSNRCPGTIATTYTANSAGATSITYSISNSGTGTQPVINASTGAVTFAANWSGTSIITATAQGCKGPKTSSHTVTTGPQVGTPVFTPNSNRRCSGASSVDYTATASGATSITYSISNTGTGTQPSIVASTGRVTYPANWIGTSTITALASGCSTTSSATFVVSSKAVHAIDDEATGEVGTPLIFNVLTNDLCSPNASTLTLVTQPANGIVQIGTGGQLTYLPNGNFVGTDTFVYRVCNAPAGDCSEATVTVRIIGDGVSACSNVGLPHTYYVPFPENTTQLRKALRSASSSTSHTTQAQNILSIKTNYAGTVIYYDHWEDGFETTAGTKTQSTTQVWGDGNLTNGVAPGYSTDILPEGAIINLESTFAYRAGGGDTTSNSSIQYDGRDKIYTSNPITMVKVVADAGTVANPLMPIQSLKTNVVDMSKFGNLYVIPFGEDIYNLQNPTQFTTVFNYVGVFVRASKNGTVVTLDYNGPNVSGGIIQSPVLAEGQVWFYDGYETEQGTPPAGNNQTGSSLPPNKNGATDIKSGAIITSNHPVGVDLVFGDLFNFGTRNIPILPAKYYGNTYFSPVHTAPHTIEDAVDGVPTYAIFANSLSAPITVNWQSGLGSAGSVVIPANGYTSLKLTDVAAYRFKSASGQSFTAVTIIDVAESSVSSGLGAHAGGFDWAFSMIPEEQLSSFVSTAWAPGRYGTTQSPSQNYHPVWVTTPTATTIYVKYNGQVKGTSGSTSPCGLKYDITYPVSALQSLRILDPNDGDQTGMSIYTCDGTKISGVWGQYSATAPAGSPGLDVGYVLTPECMNHILEAYDDRSVTFPDTPVTISVLNNDVGVLEPSQLTVVTDPLNGTYTVNPNGTIVYTPNPGFIGTDTLTYQICNADRSLCDTAVVTIVVGCYNVEWKHNISGKVFTDENYNAVLDSTEDGYQHTVNLYRDTNGNGILDASETTPIQTKMSESNGNYLFQVDTPAPTTQATHDFATASYTAGTGWASGWVEEGETTSPSAGSIQIVSGQLRFTGDATRSIKRTVTGATNNAILTFDYRGEGLEGLATERLVIQAGPTATGPWTELGTLQSINSLSTSTVSYNIPSSLVRTGTTIRFTTSGIQDDFIYVDNVRVQSIATVNYIAQLAQPIPTNKFQTLPVAPATAYPIAMRGFDSSCNLNFGLADIVDPCAISDTNPDSDGDGISDYCDVDDDNDGILDTAECSNTINDMFAVYSGGGLTNIAPSDFGLALGVRNQSITRDLSAKFGYPANSGAVIIALSNASVHPGSDAWWTKDGEAPSVWKITGTMSAFVLMSQNPEYYGQDSKTIHIYDQATVIPVTVPTMENQTAVPGTWGIIETSTAKSLRNLQTASTSVVNNPTSTGSGNWRYVNMNFGAKHFGFSTTTPHANPTYAVLLYLECDTDGDGIPNRLDLDSDADGCADAFEGGADMKQSDLLTAGGTLSGGSTAVSQNICTICVSTSGTNIGLPQITTPPANYSNTTGQSVGNSQNGAIKNCYCTQPPSAGTGEITKVGISVQQKQDGWPENIPNGHIVLESKEKGMVITRVNHVSFVPQATDSVATPFAGMLVYDIQDACVKLYNGINWKCIERSCNDTSN